MGNRLGGRHWGLCEIGWSGRSGRGLGADYTVQREHLALLGWAERLSGYSVRFGGLGGLGGFWGGCTGFHRRLRRQWFGFIPKLLFSVLLNYLGFLRKK